MRETTVGIRLGMVVTILALLAAACAEPDIAGSESTSAPVEEAVRDGQPPAPGPDDTSAIEVESGETSTTAASSKTESADDEPEITPTTTTVTPSSHPPAGADGTVPDYLIDELIAYAAELWGVPTGDVAVESSSPWSWPDTAFGCPEPGKSYSQVLTDGYWVVLSAHGQSLDLRVNLDRTFIECRLPEERSP